MRNYSQSNEQEVILKYFNGRTGTFIDIGANDGVTYSNTRALALSGWRGVLVEPDKRAFERLENKYKGKKGFYCYPFALGSHNGVGILNQSGSINVTEIYENERLADIGLVSTFHVAEMNRFNRITAYDPAEVKVFKWKTFLNRLSIKEFTMVNIDVEGSEMEILPDMDLSKTELVCIEWNSKPELKKEYDYYLKEFKVIYTSAENLIYARFMPPDFQRRAIWS